MSGTTLKEAISGFFAGRLRKSKEAPGMVTEKEPEGLSGPKDLGGFTVGLIEPARSAVTPVELIVVAILKRDGQTSLEKLVERVARELYFDEVRKGARVLDIGLYGPDLFVPDVISELKAGDGILWEIEQEEGCA